MTYRIIHWGLGAMGLGMAKIITKRPDYQIVGAVDIDPNKLGKDLGELLSTDPIGVKVQQDPAEVIGKTPAEVVLIATESFTREVFDKIMLAVNHKLNVITIAEEMAYPWAQSPELAAKIDTAAKENGVTVLGTGVNPGFVLDTLIIALTGVCAEVTKIKAARINDLSPFGPTVMRTQGVGTTPEEFKRGLENGSIVGHVGFPESISMIAKALGVTLDEIREVREPIISKVYRETPHVKVEPGMVAGCRHSGYGIKDGKVIIELIHPQQIHPHLEGVETGDYIEIEGTPRINLKISPEIPGGIATMAIAVNMVPEVTNARAGLLTMADLPVPRGVFAELQKLTREE